MPHLLHRLRSLGRHAEAWTLLEREDVIVFEHDVEAVEIAGEAAHLHVIALPDNDHVVAVANEGRDVVQLVDINESVPNAVGRISRVGVDTFDPDGVLVPPQARSTSFIRVPDVVTRLSRSRVLVTEYVQGAGFDDVKRMGAEERNRLPRLSPQGPNNDLSQYISIHQQE